MIHDRVFFLKRGASTRSFVGIQVAVDFGLTNKHILLKQTHTKISSAQRFWEPRVDIHNSLQWPGLTADYANARLWFLSEKITELSTLRTLLMQTLSPMELSHKMWQDGVVIASTLVLHSMNFGAKKKKTHAWAPREEGGLKEHKPKKIRITQQKLPRPSTELIQQNRHELPSYSQEVSNVAAVNYMLNWAAQKTGISFTAYLEWHLSAKHER